MDYNICFPVLFVIVGLFCVVFVLSAFKKGIIKAGSSRFNKRIINYRDEPKTFLGYIIAGLIVGFIFIVMGIAFLLFF